MSEPVHRIRLREPWRTGEQPGEILLYRRFGKPGNLTTDQKVWIVFPENAVFLRVLFNGQPLDPAGRRWEVSAALAERNEIEVAVHEGSDSTPVTTGVVLEIVG